MVLFGYFHSIKYNIILCIIPFMVIVFYLKKKRKEKEEEKNLVS